MKKYYTIISIAVAMLFFLTAVSFAAGYEKFFGDDPAKMPAGWTKGEKKGWDGQRLPPGLFKKLPNPEPAENPAEPDPLDVTGDGKVDMADVEAFQGAFGTKEGDENWDPKFDLNEDGVVNLQDVFILRGKINLPQNPA